jgi:group I intron endonuclease
LIGIYKITSPGGKVYIGQSVDIKRRWANYRWEYKKFTENNSKLFNSLKKYGIENHSFEIKQECAVEELNERERYWQEFYNVIEDGLNCKFVESFEKSGFVSDETRIKISKAKKGKVSPMLGKRHSKETIAKMSIAAKKRKQNTFRFTGKHSEFSKKKISESKLGIPAKNKRRVLQISTEGVLIKEWESVTSASIELKISGIKNVVTKRAKTSGGFYWKYK